MNKIYNLSYDIADDNVRASIINILYRNGDIDEKVKFIINGNSNYPHVVLKPAATTLIFGSNHTCEAIMKNLLKLEGDNKFALFEISISGNKLNGSINSVVLQSEADDIMNAVIKKRKNNDNFTQRMDNIKINNKNSVSIQVVMES